jgi:hypothetical protein
VLGDCYGKIARSDAWRIFGVPDERQTKGPAPNLRNAFLANGWFDRIPGSKDRSRMRFDGEWRYCFWKPPAGGKGAARTARACPPLRSSANTKK